MRRTSEIGRAAAAGIGATVVMDVGAEVIRRTTGVPSLDYALLGRWLGHMPRGRFRHDDIRAAEPVPYEKEVGWAAHYAIGTGFALALAAAMPRWPSRPTMAPALVTGLATTAAPWLVMQPAFGLGVAASKTPDPTTARLRSLRAHALYGVGLWVSGRAVDAVTGGRTDPALARPR